MKFELTSGQRSIVSSVEAFTQGEFKPNGPAYMKIFAMTAPKVFSGWGRSGFET